MFKLIFLILFSLLVIIQFANLYIYAQQIGFLLWKERENYNGNDKLLANVIKFFLAPNWLYNKRIRFWK